MRIIAKFLLPVSIMIFCISCQPEKKIPDITYEGKTLEQWLQQLRTNEAREAAEALMQIGEPAVPFMVDMLDRDEVLPLLLETFQKMGPQAKDAIPELVRGMVLFPDELLQNQTRIALEKIGRPKDEQLPELMELLKDRRFAAYAALELAKMGNVAVEAVPLLINYLRDTRRIRENAAFALGEIGSPDAAEPLAIHIDNEPFFIIRKKTAIALAKIGSQAQDAVPLLQEILTKNDELTNIWVRFALFHITNDKIYLEKIKSDAESQDPFIKKEAAEALELINNGIGNQ